MSKRVLSSLIALALAGITGQASGAGFAIMEQSVSGLGNAFAGSAAIAEDASTVWFNPAGMSRLKGAQIQTGLHYISPKFDFKDSGSIQTLGGAPIGALLPTADKTENGGQAAAVPNFYYTRPLSDVVNFGLGVNAPFGLETNYDDQWIGRYHTQESEILTLHINPALSWKVHDKVTVAAGVNLQYIKARLTNAVDFSAVCFGAAARGGVPTALLSPTCGAALPGGAAVPGAGLQDGRVVNRADDWSWGLNFGLLLEPTDHTRVGLTYRTKMRHRLAGKTDFEIPASITALAGIPATARLGGGIAAAFADTNVHSTIELPDMATLSVYHEITPRWAAMADVTWTGWSTIQDLVLEFENPLQPNGVESLKFDDSWRFSAAVNFKPTKKIVLRLGGAFDQSPTPNATERSPRLPDNDRIWLSAGAGYKVLPNLQLDIAYTHLFIDDTKISRTGSTGAVLNGEYESDANLFSGGLSYTF